MSLFHFVFHLCSLEIGGRSNSFSFQIIRFSGNGFPGETPKIGKRKKKSGKEKISNLLKSDYDDRAHSGITQKHIKLIVFVYNVAKNKFCL